MDSLLSELLVIVALILVNGVFAAAEISIVSLRQSRARQLQEDGRSGADWLVAVRKQPETLLATVQIGITVAGATAAAYGGETLAIQCRELLAPMPVVGPHAELLGLAAVVTLVSYLSIVLGELVPKSLALRHAETVALLLARPVSFLAWLAKPAVWFLSASSNVVLKPFGDSTSFTETHPSIEELGLMVREAARTGSIEPASGELASRAFEFAELQVKDVMVPRSRICAVSSKASHDDVVRKMVEEGFARLPVYENELDRVVGYVSSRDVLTMLADEQLVILSDLLRPLLVVPETVKASKLLTDLQRRRMPLAIAVDEFGMVSGLVTLEDLIEELVGEIFSDHEKGEPPLLREAEGVYLARADTPIRVVNRELDIGLQEDDRFTTLAGLCMSLAGEIPAPETVLSPSKDVRLQVVSASTHRIHTVRVKILRKTVSSSA